MAKYDPRSKLFLVMVISSLGVFITDILLLSLITIIGIGTAHFFGADIFGAFKKMKRLFGMIVMIAFLQSIFNGHGKVLLELFGIQLLTLGGLTGSCEFILRMTIIVISATIVTTATSREMVQGLIQLKIPYEIAFTVSLGVRFLPMLKEEIIDTFTALKLRGIVFKEISWKEKINIYSYLFLPIIAGTIKKAEKIALSMDTKGFRVKKKRNSFLVLTYHRRDFILMIITTLVLSGILYINWKRNLS